MAFGHGDKIGLVRVSRLASFFDDTIIILYYDIRIAAQLVYVIEILIRELQSGLRLHQFVGVVEGS